MTMCWILSIHARLPATAPAMTSEWPARPLVALWTTMSKPRESGRCKGVVDDGDEIVFFGKGDGFLEIDEAHGGIGGRLDVEDFGERGEQAVEPGEIGLDLAHGDAKAGEDVAHEAVGAAVELGGGDNFVAGFQRGEERVGDGGHARGGDDGGFGAFEGGDFAFGDGERWVAVAGVNVGFAFAFGPALHFGGGGEGEGGRA